MVSAVPPEHGVGHDGVDAGVLVMVTASSIFRVALYLCTGVSQGGAIPDGLS